MTLLLALACSPHPTSKTPATNDSTATTTDSADSAGDTGGPVNPYALAAEVDQATLLADITSLQDFGTRYSGTTGNDDARAWIEDQLTATGLDTEEDPFAAGINVIARKPGTTHPERIWVFSAHYDDTSEQPQTLAPGADDNGSGVATVLSAARILGPHAFEDTIWFVTMGAEEQGSLGSAHLAQVMNDDGLDVQGVIAPDMMAYWPLQDGDAFDILGDDASAGMVSNMADIADHLGVANKMWIEHHYCEGDDHTSFQDAGIPAMSPMDCVEAHNVPSSGETVPYYHTSGDVVDTLYLPFTARVAQVIVASLASWAEPS